MPEDPTYFQWLAGRESSRALLDEYISIYEPPLWQAGGGFFSFPGYTAAEEFEQFYGFAPGDLPEEVVDVAGAAGEFIGETVGEFVGGAVREVVKPLSGVLLVVVGVVALAFIWKG